MRTIIESIRRNAIQSFALTPLLALAVALPGQAQLSADGGSHSDVAVSSTASTDSAASPVPAAADESVSSSALPSDPGPASPQYGPQRPGYGRPGERRAQSAYGSQWSRVILEGGAGFSTPPGGTSSQLNTGYNITLGAGYHFTPYFGVVANYQFNRFDIPGRVLQELGEPDGNVHVWSLTMNPVVNLNPHGRLDPYVTAGGGFYRKLTSFTQQVYLGDECDFYYCYPVIDNVLLSHYSSNQGGFQAGAGFNYKLSPRDSNASVFAEAKYNWLDTPGGSTQMIPVTFGFRW